MAYSNYYPAGYQQLQYYPQIQSLQNVPQQAQYDNAVQLANQLQAMLTPGAHR